MKANTNNGGFQIRRLFAKEHGYRYETFQVVGYLKGQRIESVSHRATKRSEN